MILIYLCEREFRAKRMIMQIMLDEELNNHEEIYLTQVGLYEVMKKTA